RNGLSETRHALKALRSSPLDDLGLVMALQLAADQAANRAGFTLQTDFPDANPEMPHELALNIVRITEEALNNIVRHAEASHVWISLTTDEGNIQLKIRDNGVGFDTSTSADGHYGLVGMRERAALCGADLTIESEQHFGTTIIFSVKET
ncbi:MAG: ATP-binding protein, partial [Chloroflexota bacterium]